MSSKLQPQVDRDVDTLLIEKKGRDYIGSTRSKSLINRMLIASILGIVALMYILPFYWMIITALKPQEDLFKFPPTLIPETITIENFLRVFEVVPLGRAYWNTFYTSVIIVISQLIFCSVAGYVFEKIRFRFREFLFTVILITMIIPFQSEMVPMFLLMSDLRLVNTHAALILPAMITPFAIFFFRQNIKAIPNDLLDAAKIDGSGLLGRYWHVVVPNIKPAIGTITIFAFLGAWNNFLWPLIILNSRKMMLIEQVLAILGSAQTYEAEEAARMAGATMAIIPILIVFFFSQRYFVRGIALTGLK